MTNYLFDEDQFCPDKKLVSMLTGNDARMAETHVATVLRTKVCTSYVTGFGELMNINLQPDLQNNIITNGEIDLTSFVAWLNVKFGVLRRVLICAWSFGQIDVLSLKRMAEMKKVITLDVLSSDMHPKKHKADHQELLFMRKEGLVRNYCVAPIHAKMILCETLDGRKIVVNSTANSTLYSCVECSVITQSSELYDFYDGIFSNMEQFDAEDNNEKNTDYENYEHSHVLGD